MRKIAAFYSDAHFGHHNILTQCNRPFDDIEEMNGELLDRYNKVIEEGDTVLWLGDCFFHAAYEGIFDEMNGTKILVLGNHDKSASAMARMGFALVLHEAIINIAGVTCRINHFPYSQHEGQDKFTAKRPRKLPGEVLIHGHSHRSTPIHDNQIDVGVDAWDYRPAMYYDVENCVKQIKGIKT